MVRVDLSKNTPKCAFLYNVYMKFIALLRGINVGGKNKVTMPELKACFEEIGFKSVVTYINSGNVLFESDVDSTTELVGLCEDKIHQTFGFRVVCAVIRANDLVDAVDHAPDWWNKGGHKHNAIFVIAPKTADEIMQEVGEAKPEYEKVAAYHPIIFWSAPLETFGRTRYNKIVGTPAYQFITIRNANTTTKLAELCRQ